MPTRFRRARRARAPGPGTTTKRPTDHVILTQLASNVPLAGSAAVPVRTADPARTAVGSQGRAGSPGTADRGAVRSRVLRPWPRIPPSRRRPAPRGQSPGRQAAQDVPCGLSQGTAARSRRRGNSRAGRQQDPGAVVRGGGRRPAQPAGNRPGGGPGGAWGTAHPPCPTTGPSAPGSHPRSEARGEPPVPHGTSTPHNQAFVRFIGGYRTPATGARVTGRESRGRRPWVSDRCCRREPHACYGQAFVTGRESGAEGPG